MTDMNGISTRTAGYNNLPGNIKIKDISLAVANQILEADNQAAVESIEDLTPEQIQFIESQAAAYVNLRDGVTGAWNQAEVEEAGEVEEAETETKEEVISRLKTQYPYKKPTGDVFSIEGNANNLRNLNAFVNSDDYLELVSHFTAQEMIEIIKAVFDQDNKFGNSFSVTKDSSGKEKINVPFGHNAGGGKAANGSEAAKIFNNIEQKLSIYTKDPEKLASLQAEIAQLETDISGLKENIAGYNSQIIEYNTEITNYDTQIKQLQRNYNSNLKKINELLDEIDKKKNEASAIQKEADKAAENARQQSTDAASEIKKESAEAHTNILNKHAQLLHDYENGTITKDEYDAGCSNINSEMLHSGLTSYSKFNDAAKSMAKAESLYSKLGPIASAVSRLTGQVTSLVQQNASLKTQIRGIETERNNAASAANNLLNARSKDAQALAAKESELAAKKAELSAEENKGSTGRTDPIEWEDEEGNNLTLVIDENSDGLLNGKSELAGAETDYKEQLRQRDANGDGRLTRDECKDLFVSINGSSELTCLYDLMEDGDEFAYEDNTETGYFKDENQEVWQESTFQGVFKGRQTTVEQTFMTDAKLASIYAYADRTEGAGAFAQAESAFNLSEISGDNKYKDTESRFGMSDVKLAEPDLSLVTGETSAYTQITGWKEGLKTKISNTYDMMNVDQSSVQDILAGNKTVDLNAPIVPANNEDDDTSNNAFKNIQSAIQDFSNTTSVNYKAINSEMDGILGQIRNNPSLTNAEKSQLLQQAKGVYNEQISRAETYKSEYGTANEYNTEKEKMEKSIEELEKELNPELSANVDTE